jgi:hypothetical protein
MSKRAKLKQKTTHLADYYSKKHTIPYPQLCKGFEIPIIGSLWYTGGPKRKQLFMMHTIDVELLHDFGELEDVVFKEPGFLLVEPKDKDMQQEELEVDQNCWWVNKQFYAEQREKYFSNSPDVAAQERQKEAAVTARQRLEKEEKEKADAAAAGPAQDVDALLLQHDQDKKKTKKRGKKAGDVNAAASVIIPHFNTTGETGTTKKKGAVWKKYRCKHCGKIYQQVLPGTGNLTKHLKFKHWEIYTQAIVESSHTTVREDENGEVHTIFTFEEAFAHHVRYVLKLASLQQAPYENLNKENRMWMTGLNRQYVPPSYPTINRYDTVPQCNI